MSTNRVPSRPPPITLERVSHRVSRYAGLARFDRTNKTRLHVQARWLAMLLARDFGYTYAEIGRHLGLDHTSVIAGIRRCRALLEEHDPWLIRALAHVSHELAGDEHADSEDAMALALAEARAELADTRAELAALKAAIGQLWTKARSGELPKVTDVDGPKP